MSKTVILNMELVYDDKIMHGDDQEAIDWFWNLMYGNYLYLFEGSELGDTIGKLKLLSVEDTDNE